MSKRRGLFTWLIVEPPGSHVLFYILVAPFILLDGVPGNTEDVTDVSFNLGDVLIFPRTLLRVNFFIIGLAGVVSTLVYFIMDMMYDLSWSSVGASGEASALADLIDYESVF